MHADFSSLSCEDFAAQLAAKGPVPGGGGAAAYVGALAAALSSMVGEFTIGKPRYAEFDADVERILAGAARLRTELVSLVGADADAYSQVAAAYKIDRKDPDRPQAIDDALHEAVKPPLAIMRACCEVIALHEELAEKGSRMLLSDVACGTLMARAALEAASFGVTANTCSFIDRGEAKALDADAKALLDEWVPRSEAVVARVNDVMGRDF